MCVAKVIDGRISVSEQLLRGGCRTDRTARDGANGPEKRPPVLPRPAHGTGSSPSLISTHKASMIVTTLNRSVAPHRTSGHGRAPSLDFEYPGILAAASE